MLYMYAGTVRSCFTAPRHTGHGCTLAYIEAETGFRVTIRQKHHKFLLDFVRECPSTNVQDVPAVYLKSGNCIPCAMWHLAETCRQTMTTYLSDVATQANVTASRRGYRTSRLKANREGSRECDVVGYMLRSLE